MPRGVCRSVLVLLLLTVAFVAAAEHASAAKPNVVLVLTDDQRWDTLSAMPTVSDELIAKGVTFSNAVVSNARCCPSRTSTLTGQYSQRTRIYRNPGFPRFDDSSTIATWLQDDGYRTGLIGKYLIGYRGPYIPPGWDEWASFTRSANYYNYSLAVNGTTEAYGTRASDYSTDVLAAKADAFVRSTRPDTPLFLVLSPFAPHGRLGDRLEATPAPRHVDRFGPPLLDPWRPLSYNEEDVSDKPDWIQRLDPLTPDRGTKIDRFRQTQLEALQAVDEAVGTIVAALEDTGRLANTMIVFTSDNGHAWGEHRWHRKAAPYEESIRVPLVVRYDPLTNRRRVDGHLAANIDLAPTFADVAGVQAPDAQGRSLVPLLKRRRPAWGRHILLEHVSPPIPTFCGIRTNRHTYVQYVGGQEELYDLALDPYQLESLEREPSARRAIVSFRKKVADKCRPHPPAYTPRSPCLIGGTPRSDRLRGTRFYELICARDGADRVSAKDGGDEIDGARGNDKLHGDAGDDRISGGLGADLIYGDAGRDRLEAVDGRKDILDCGIGVDRATVDDRDTARRCETVRRR